MIKLISKWEIKAGMGIAFYSNLPDHNLCMNEQKMKKVSYLFFIYFWK